MMWGTLRNTLAAENRHVDSMYIGVRHSSGHGSGGYRSLLSYSYVIMLQYQNQIPLSLRLGGIELVYSMNQY
jgi:hypothetical protein